MNLVPARLEDLLRDFCLRDFLERDHEVRPWRGRLRDPDLAGALWNGGHLLDELLYRGRFDRGDLRVVRRGIDHASLGDADERVLRQALADGYTFALTLASRNGPVGAIVARFEETFRCRAHAVLYVTPAGSRGFDLHHDYDDVFVLQLHGEKHWLLADPIERLPLDNRVWREDEVAGMAPLHLAVGDVLYLPRGTIHAAETRAVDSVHLTVSTMRERIFERDRDVFMRALGDRGAMELPPGWDDPAVEAGLAAAIDASPVALPPANVRGATREIADALSGAHDVVVRSGMPELGAIEHELRLRVHVEEIEVDAEPRAIRADVRRVLGCLEGHLRLVEHDRSIGPGDAIVLHPGRSMRLVSADRARARIAYVTAPTLGAVVEAAVRERAMRSVEARRYVPIDGTVAPPVPLSVGDLARGIRALARQWHLERCRSTPDETEIVLATGVRELVRRSRAVLRLARAGSCSALVQRDRSFALSSEHEDLLRHVMRSERLDLDALPIDFDEDAKQAFARKLCEIGAFEPA